MQKSYEVRIIKFSLAPHATHSFKDREWFGHSE
jgi:hypothetical protein